jgi:thiol-disulfide isomerase/thioredoxin
MNELQKRLSNPTDLVIVLLGIILVVLVGYYVYKQHFSENFQETTTSKSETVEVTEYIILLYHASWCPHCTAFLPEWKSLGNNITMNGSPVRVLDMQVDDESAAKNLSKMYKLPSESLEGYPTVLLYKVIKINSEIYSTNRIAEYNGNRTAQDITDFLEDFSKKL